MQRHPPRVPAPDRQPASAMRSARPRSSPASQRFSLINALRTGHRLPGARLRVPGRRQRRQQRGRADEHHRVQRSTRGAERVRPGDCPRQPAADHAAQHRQRVRAASEPGRAARALGRAEAVGRVQRRAARAAADARAITTAARRVRTSCSRTPIRSRSGRRRSPIASAQTGWGGRTADRFEPHASGFPMITALSGGIFTRGQTTSPLSIAAGADGAQSGAGAERIRHRRRRSRATERRWTSCGRIDTDVSAGRPRPAARRSRRSTSGRSSAATSRWRRRFRTPRSATS